MSSKLNLSFCNFCVGHSSLSIPRNPDMKKNDQQLRSGEFSKVRGVPWRDNTLFSTFHADHPRNWPQSKVMNSRPHITLNRFRCIQSQLDNKTLFFFSYKLFDMTFSRLSMRLDKKKQKKNKKKQKSPR